MAEVVATEDSTNHLLHDKWTVWAHLPHDTDWSLNSYKHIFRIETVEEAITLTETLPEKMIKNCMLFIMRDGIHPTWEDPQNANGGCFSYKISNKSIKEAWKLLTYRLIGETLVNDEKLSNMVNGITISPKKNFCIIKIWCKTCDHQNAKIIKPINDLIIPHGCLFKKHKP